jgi:hypothetical protein
MIDDISFIYYKKIREFGINVVHLWNGSDTLCNLFGKKQLYKDRYVLTDSFPEDTERLICNRCADVLERKIIERKMRDSIRRSTK